MCGRYYRTHLQLHVLLVGQAKPDRTAAGVDGILERGLVLELAIGAEALVRYAGDSEPNTVDLLICTVSLITR